MTKRKLEMKNCKVTADEIFAGIYAWFQANPWFTKVDIHVVDFAQEGAAQQAVLAVYESREVFERLSPGVQGLAARFIYSFMAELQGPMAGRVWTFNFPADAPHDPARLAWLAIEQEIAQTNPPPAKPH